MQSAAQAPFKQTGAVGIHPCNVKTMSHNEVLVLDRTVTHNPVQDKNMRCNNVPKLGPILTAE